MNTELYWGLAIVFFLAVNFLISKTEFWEEAIDDDFGIYLLGWVCRLFVTGLLASIWPISLVLFALAGVAWLAWAGQKQKWHVKRYGNPDEDYDWRTYAPSFKRKESSEH